MYFTIWCNLGTFFTSKFLNWYFFMLLELVIYILIIKHHVISARMHSFLKMINTYNSWRSIVRRTDKRFGCVSLSFGFSHMWVYLVFWGSWLRSLSMIRKRSIFLTCHYWSQNFIIIHLNILHRLSYNLPLTVVIIDIYELLTLF